MQILANLSFSIYMVHALVLIALLTAVRSYGRAHGLPLFRMVPNPFAHRPGAHPSVEVLHVASAGAAGLLVLAYLAGIAVATFLVYRFVEIPGRTWFNLLAGRLSLFVASFRTTHSRFGDSMEHTP